jgi:hypothetical protein
MKLVMQIHRHRFFILVGIFSLLFYSCSPDNTRVAQGIPGNPGPAGAPGLQGPPGIPGSNAMSPEAQIILDKYSSTLDSPLTIIGSGFTGGDNVQISVKLRTPNSTFSVLLQEGIKVNWSGSFIVRLDDISTDVSYSSKIEGIVTILATGTRFDTRASAPLEIINNDGAATFFIDNGADLVASPIQNGENSDIYGSGFVPEEEISVLIVGVNNGADKIIAGTEANYSGAFIVSPAIELEIGLYTIRAIGRLGSVATAPLLIVQEK